MPCSPFCPSAAANSHSYKNHWGGGWNLEKDIRRHRYSQWDGEMITLGEGDLQTPVVGRGHQVESLEA